MDRKEIIKALRERSSKNQKLKKDDFSLSNGASNQRSKIAEFEAEVPLIFRPAPIRLVFATIEEYTSNGTADDTETFNLGHNIIDTPSTQPLILYESGNRVQADSVDYDANTFDYTDDGTDNTLHAAYIARDPVQVEIQREAPRAQGQITDVVYDDVTSLLHERNQNKEPPEMGFNSPLEQAVPRNWKVKIIADGPLPFEWDDSDETTVNGDEATNAIVSIPISRYKGQIEGLSKAVKRDIVG